MSNIIIPATYSAVTTLRQNIYQDKLPISYVATNLSPGEEIVFQTSADNGVTWFDLYVAGTKCTITSFNMVRTLYAPLIIRLVKGITLNQVSVCYYKQNLEGQE